jgi:hypothetical protein
LYALRSAAFLFAFFLSGGTPNPTPPGAGVINIKEKMLSSQHITNFSHPPHYQGRSCDLPSGSVDPDDFFKINDKLLFIMNPTQQRNKTDPDDLLDWLHPYPLLPFVSD